VPKKWKGNTSGKVNWRIRDSWEAFVDKKWQDIYFGGEANEGNYYYGG
jgi:hypothetical protein